MTEGAPMPNPYEAQDIRLPKQRRGVARWLLPIVTGFAGLVFGFAVAGGGSQAPDPNCAALADDYAALVSEGIDAGLSMDEAQMAEVVAKRDALRGTVEDSCG